MKIGNREKREIKENKTEKELEPKRAAATQFGPLGFPPARPMFSPRPHLTAHRGPSVGRCW